MHYKHRCNENCASRIERQARMITHYRNQYKRLLSAVIQASNEITKLKAEKQQLTEAYNQLAIKLQSTERQLDTMRACDADKARQLKGFHSEKRRRLNMAVISPDRHFDSKPRRELW